MHETNANDLNSRDDSVAWKSRRASLTNLFFKPFLALLCGTLLAKTSVSSSLARPNVWFSTLVYKYRSVLMMLFR